MLFAQGPSHAEITQLVADARAGLIGEGLLTADELNTMEPKAAANLAVKRWNQKNPSWPELPEAMR